MVPRTIEHAWSAEPDVVVGGPCIARHHLGPQ